MYLDEKDMFPAVGDSCSLHKSRLDALKSRLAAAQELVEQQARGDGEVAAVCQRLQGWFSKVVNEVVETLEPMRVAIGSTGGDEEAWRKAWRGLTDAEALTKRAVADALEVVGGALLRAAGADDGLARVADALLHRLAASLDLPFDRLVLVATGEHMRRGGWIVYLRYPIDVWSLPIAVHELGHVAVERLEDGRGERQLRAVAEKAAAARDPSWLTYARAHELLADGLATLLLGPAYTGSLIWRSSPSTADLHDGDHPSWATRVVMSLATLEDLHRADAVPAEMLGSLRELWATERRSAADACDLGPFGEKTLAALRSAVAPKHRFPGLGEALGAASDLRDGRQPTVRDPIQLINAAWLIRLERPWCEHPGVAELSAAALRAVQA
jgi:hypothetical protein